MIPSLSNPPAAAGGGGIYQYQGLMRVEGAVVRHVSGKSSSSSPWRVLVTEKEQFVQVCNDKF